MEGIGTIDKMNKNIGGISSKIIDFNQAKQIGLIKAIKHNHSLLFSKSFHFSFSLFFFIWNSKIIEDYDSNLSTEERRKSDFQK